MIDDISDIPTLFRMLPEYRLRRVFSRHESLKLAQETLNTTFRSEYSAIKALYQFYADDESAPECICPPARGRRWLVTPVNWSYDQSGQQFNYRAVIQQLLADIQSVCGIRFEESPEGKKGHIHISNGEIDGRGGTLGMAYQPARGDDMAACGPMCGDVIIDMAERWTLDYFRAVMLHELLHAIGLPHSNDRRSIMYPRYIGPRGMHEVDIAELLVRYPLPRFA